MDINEKLKKYQAELVEKKELYLRVKAHPGAMETGIKEIMDDETIKIDIAAPPVKGRANNELIRFLAQYFNINKKQIMIISGQAEKIKLLKIKS
jgi:uncharacterized protein (TIGR00251 family)